MSALNSGHGHVFARPDGIKARCGGPMMCRHCAADLSRLLAQQQTPQKPLDPSKEQWR